MDDRISTDSTGTRQWMWGLALALCVGIAYANSFYGVFHLDDTRVIEQNESLRTLSAPGQLFLNPENISRPFVAFTFALDYALFGPKPGGFHALNLAVHLIAALLLFGIVRRSMLTQKVTAQIRAAATPLAFSAALIWALHPLQTQAVTYIVQRMESMMGMFFLLSLYCVIRGAESKAATAWSVGAILAAACGGGCKQVIVVLPFVAILYDRCFISGSFKAAWKRAPVVFVGLFASWLVVGTTMFLISTFQAAGFGLEKVRPWNYAWSQFVVIVYYLKLTFWPVGLCLDYAWKIEHDPLRIVPCAVLVLSLLGATIWQLRKNTAVGFCGAWFFLTLAPTSTILPIADLAVEHRMYLALAAIAVLFVALVFVAFQKMVVEQSEAKPIAARMTLGLCVVLGAVLGVGTILRNMTYADAVTMMEDVISKRPENPRAYALIAMNALHNQDGAKALEYINKAVALRPNLSETHLMKGYVLQAQHDVAGAIGSFETALTINPISANAWASLCDAWILREKGNVAVKRIASALKRAPNNVAIHLDLGNEFATLGKWDDAVFEFNTVLKLQPENENAIVQRGTVYGLAGKQTEAVTSYRAALVEDPNRAGVANALAWILSTSPNDAIRNGKEAVIFAEHACEQTQNQHPLMLDTLAAAYAEAGQFDKAAATAEKALSHAPPNSNLSKEIQEHLAQYKSGKPHREKN